MQKLLPMYYCMDTCALICLRKTYYPPDIFCTLWKNLENFISSGLVVAPNEVFEEIKKHTDEVYQWAKKHKNMFIDFDNDQQIKLKEVLNKFPDLSNRIKSKYKTNTDADPIIISLSLSKGYIIVTEDKNLIKDCMEKLKIRCINLTDFFRNNNWNF